MKKIEYIPLIEIKSNCKSFQWKDEPELIHVIKTGFNDRYMIVHEDAYELNLGKVEFMTKNEIKQIYKIDL
jgi:hypothetical protein